MSEPVRSGGEDMERGDGEPPTVPVSDVEREAEVSPEDWAEHSRQER